MNTGSLRRRVALVTLPLLVIALAGSATVVTVRYRQGLEHDLRDRLLAGAKAINGAPLDQVKSVISALSLQGIATQVSGHSDPAAIGRKPGRAPEARSAGQLLVVRIPLEAGLGGYVATLKASRASVDRAVRRLVVIEIAVALAAVAIAALLLLRGLRSALQPLAHVGAVAARIAGGAHDERLRPDRPQTELGRMAAAFDHMVDELEESIARARRSESAMRRFLADASHELRTPIAALQASAETLLREQPERPERDELEARVAGDAARLGRLVADLLDLARLEANEELARKPVDVGVVAARAAAEASGHLPGTTVDVESDDSAIVLGDADALARALRNLVDNAITAAGPPGRVSVSVERDGADVLASVEDDGPGVPAAERERIFEGFVRLEPVRGPGAGLGLAIARRVAREHGGDLTYADGGRGGARFDLRLPAAAPAPVS
ncbi:MAG TPA: HAMP domain-containing sensor histidine kinase [Thermoleophilaceae bacterium]|nr:HAMP domain-containing sensor histidine kinase [Thermoleophilaceae bacterium]